MTSGWSNNFDARPHRRLVTPRRGEWIRQTFPHLIHGYWAHMSESLKWHLDQFSHFSMAHERDQNSHVQTPSVAIAHNQATYAMHAMWPNNSANANIKYGSNHKQFNKLSTVADMPKVVQHPVRNFLL